MMWRLLLLVALAVLAPVVGEAQPAGKVHRIGWLSGGSRSASADLDQAFREALQPLGHAEGRTLLIEYRFADGQPERLRGFADELIGLKVDAIVTQGTAASLAAKQATKSIPIVTLSTSDPVGSGLVASLGRPGGNVTGVSAVYSDIAGKWVELLRQIVPGLSRIAFLGNVDNPGNRATFAHVQAAAGSVGVAVEYFSATRPAEIGGALTAMTKPRVDGVIVTGDALIRSHRTEIAEFIARARLPAVYFGRDYVDAGGLMSYGPSRRDIGRQAAAYVDKILKGARPADLPVEQPIKFELVISLRVASALGLVIPPALRLRADELID
jgi:putative ABC transport system substrate-binding protein